MPRKLKPGVENRGGARVGVQGRDYGNRSDLASGVRQPSPVVLAAATQPPTPPAVGLPNLMGETWYPDRPITNGMPTGPGAGPEVLGDPISRAPSESLRAWLVEHPYDEDVRQVIELLELEGR